MPAKKNRRTKLSDRFHVDQKVWFVSRWGNIIEGSVTYVGARLIGLDFFGWRRFDPMSSHWPDRLYTALRPLRLRTDRLRAVADLDADAAIKSAERQVQDRRLSLRLAQKALRKLRADLTLARKKYGKAAQS